jgi:hypothetical protein
VPSILSVTCLREPLDCRSVPSYYNFPLPPISFLFISSLFYSSNRLPVFAVTVLFSTHVCFRFSTLQFFVYHAAALNIFSPPIVFCLLIDYVFYYLSCLLLSLSSYIWFPLFLSPAPVRNFHSRNVPLQSSIDAYTFPSLLATCFNPIGWHQAAETFHHPHSSLYKPRTRIAGFLFGFLTLEIWTEELSRNVGEELPLLSA